MQILKDPRVREILGIIYQHNPESYLVGGVVRDHFMERVDRKDLDIAVKGNGCELAAQIVRGLDRRFSFVPLDARHGTGRIVIKNHTPIYIDVSSLKGPTIHEDLKRRDFTINALALNLRDSLNGRFDQVIDATGSLNDLNNRRVRICSQYSFQDDPLRILRAFRFMANLDFKVTQDTLEMIPPNLAGLSTVASERIRDEFIAILSAGQSYAALKLMDHVGVIDFIFPELVPMKGCRQNNFHHLDVWGHTLETIRQMERLLGNNAAKFRHFSTEVQCYLKQALVTDRPKITLLKLAGIFHDSGKPQTKFVDSNGRVRFFGHETVSRGIFEEVGVRLKLAKREIAFISEIIMGHMRPIVLTSESLSGRAIHRMYRKFKQDLIGLLVLFLSDLGASRGPARKPGSWERAYQRVLEAMDLVCQSEKVEFKPLVNGHDIMNAYSLRPGPLIGRLLQELLELQSMGKITTKEEALTAAGNVLSQIHPLVDEGL